MVGRRIPGSTACDGLAAVPFLMCSDWSQLRSDLQDLDGELVSVAAVPDPFGDYDVEGNCVRVSRT